MTGILNSVKNLRSWWRALALVASFALVAPVSAVGQSGERGQIEMGAFGLLSKYDGTNLGFESKPGVGGWLGYYLSRTFSIEALADYTGTTLATGQTLRVTGVGGSFMAHTRGTPFGSLYIGLGFQKLFYRGVIDAQDNAGVLLLGDRFSLGGRAAFRIEGRLSYIPGTNAQLTQPSAVNFGAAAGMSIFAFGGPPRDDDKDRVANKRDDCPNTPLGAGVDLRGCPTDGDSDRVFDGLDQCPDTPLGATVDQAGCPTDSDTDGIMDGIDVCPNTPNGASVDATGCPSDSDADGVLNGLDQCADTPTGALVNNVGCPLDSDNDSVFDGLDRCPGTPAGTPVNETGCPSDTDQDGIPDGSDQCPNTPAGARVDVRGCQIVVDSDGDGVGDTSDACPDTQPGAVVDNRGCPLAGDADGDGIPDTRDRCPNTAPNTNVDAVGCPMLLIAEAVERPLVLEGVEFESGRSSLTTESYATLDRVAEALIANPDVRIEISGHTDNTGSAQLNQRLSLQRAQAVRGYLARKGVLPARMEAVGYGEERPIASNATPETRRQNRRVELRRIDVPGN